MVEITLLLEHRWVRSLGLFKTWDHVTADRCWTCCGGQFERCGPFWTAASLKNSPYCGTQLRWCMRAAAKAGQNVAPVAKECKMPDQQALIETVVAWHMHMRHLAARNSGRLPQFFDFDNIKDEAVLLPSNMKS